MDSERASKGDPLASPKLKREISASDCAEVLLATGADLVAPMAEWQHGEASEKRRLKSVERSKRFSDDILEALSKDTKQAG